MQQHIGSTNAAAWVEHITQASSPYLRRAAKLKDFTRRSHMFPNAVEPPATISSRPAAAADATIPRHPDIEMVLKSPSQHSLSADNIQRQEARPQAREPLVTGASSKRTSSPQRINLEEVANKVYRLMQYDLIVERERTTKAGGG